MWDLAGALSELCARLARRRADNGGAPVEVTPRTGFDDEHRAAAARRATQPGGDARPPGAKTGGLDVRPGRRAEQLAAPPCTLTLPAFIRSYCNPRTGSGGFGVLGGGGGGAERDGGGEDGGGDGAGAHVVFSLRCACSPGGTVWKRPAAAAPGAACGPGGARACGQG